MPTTEAKPEGTPPAGAPAGDVKPADAVVPAGAPGAPADQAVNKATDLPTKPDAVMKGIETVKDAAKETMDKAKEPMKK